MSVDFSVFARQNYAIADGGSASLHQRNKRSLSDVVTCGLGRTRFVYDLFGGTTPVIVYFEDGSSLVRQSGSTEWEFVKDSVRMPWHGDVYVDEQEAIISSGAVADLLKIDGSHIRYLNDKIVMLVTMCGDVFEINYIDQKISEVKFNGKSYIQLKKNKWKLAGSAKPIYGLPQVSVHGFFFDAQEEYRYLDKYLTNGNLTTMRNGLCKFTFGAARI